MENTVLKFSHCDRNIFSFVCQNNLHQMPTPDDNTLISEPPRCPLCLSTMRFGLLDAPVLVPCPFSNGHKASRAFVIGSQQGPMFISECNDSELHVGITNSKGVVYNYTLSGMQRDDHGWEQCISVPLVAPGEEIFGRQWDSELETFSSLPGWSPHRFHEEREFASCCYGFVLAFINHMRRIEGKDCVSRDVFTGQHVLPHIKTVSKYLRVYQEISLHGFYIADK
ncbi:MKRN2 opposite strand, tandem duplicate 1 isoform X1 [Hypomesus transpacificus]|uniref:MKRN2 opposite strand, tandem duplicate 1 isoform X1 n=1 Tax=Hypomesus transpacificus TaxID=137520 RepID=UPI001F086185|nr:MKRN2 opposite strand, tandem duplicate 1 isoform X1 [Hypomesus transpacificus]